MQNYKTIEEKSAEWDISIRHIQHLCRNGKVDGAVKRAGSWFILENTPSPAKNSKSNADDFKFVGTKKKIFKSAIALFMSDGFDNVSLRDIADSVGIRQSTIYNHFSSKQEILDTIYNYYCHYYIKDRPNLKEMENKLQSENILDIINYIRYDFKEYYIQEMSDIAKIIFQRIGIDERAREIGKMLMVDEGIKYVEDVFNMAVETGKLAPFDVHSMAVFINSVRIFTFYCWIIDPSNDNMAKVLTDEHVLYSLAARFLTDLKSPVLHHD